MSSSCCKYSMRLGRTQCFFCGACLPVFRPPTQNEKETAGRSSRSVHFDGGGQQRRRWVTRQQQLAIEVQVMASIRKSCVPLTDFSHTYLATRSCLSIPAILSALKRMEGSVVVRIDPNVKLWQVCMLEQEIQSLIETSVASMDEKWRIAVLEKMENI
jgi:hypothetical protein